MQGRGRLEQAATRGNIPKCRINPPWEQSVPAPGVLGVLRGNKPAAFSHQEPFQSMRTEQSVPIRLEDYRPPDWLVETVDLNVALDATATRVRAALRLKPNPKAAAAAPL